MSENLQKYRYLERFLPDSKSRRLVILTGARQTGKTTLAKAKHSELNYIMLIQTRAGLIGVEIKSRKTYAKADLRTMKKISQKLGKEWRGGLLVNQGNVLRKIDEPNIWVIPSRRLFI